MAISTYGVSLKYGSESPSTEVIIKDFPSLLGKRNALETTTLSDDAQTFIPGIKQMSTMTFTYNYTVENFQAVKSDENKDLFYELEFSDGSVFSWKGRHVATIPGKGVDEVVEAGIAIAPSTPVEWASGAAE